MGAADWAIEILLGSGYRTAPAAQQLSRESTFLQASPQVRAPARRCARSVRHTKHRRMSAGSISNWRASSSIASAHGVQTDQAWPRFRAFSAMTLRQRRHRRRRPAVRSSNSNASRTVRGSPAALADDSGPDMAVNSITNRLTVTRLESDVTVWGFCHAARIAHGLYVSCHSFSAAT